MARGSQTFRAVLVLLLLALCNCGKGGGGSQGSGASAGGLPAGWSASDVGSVGSAGTTSYKSGVYSLAGSGADIWDSADAFRFLHRALAGDGEIACRVVSLDNTDAWAKAGVMIRETLDPGSKFAMTVVTPSNGVSFQHRAQTSQGCSLALGPVQPAPYWVRISRAGNTFTGSASPDGSTWTTITSQTIAMGATVFIGLCVTAHNNAASAAARFDSVTWSGASPVVGGFDPAKLGPDVYLITGGVNDGAHATLACVYVQVIDPAAIPGGNHAPVVGTVTATPSTVSPFGSVQLGASVTDQDGDPLRYAWIVPAGDTTCSGVSTETWTAPSQPGTYTLQVMVSDGKVWSKGSVTVTVSGGQGTTGTGNHPPAIRSLVANAVSVTQGQTVTITMDASDPEGDTLGYGWGASTGGSISGTTNSVTWTAPAPGSGRPAKAGLWMWSRAVPAGCPFPQSTAIPGIAFVGRVSNQHFCDTWMPTWAADGSMYSPWQDGVLLTDPFTSLGGWHAGDATALNGWAKIVGNDPQDLLIPAAGEVAGPKGSANGRYPAAMFHHNGVLYYGLREVLTYDVNGNQTTDPAQTYRYYSGHFLGFYTSTDGGANWSASPNPASPLFPEPIGGNVRHKFGQPYMVDFGKNQEHSPDGKVYFVSSGSTDASNTQDHLNDDQVYLCRVTPTVSNINDLSKYEFFAGNGTWSSSISAAQPILEWRNQVTGATMTWNPGLNKYLMFLYRNGYSHTGNQISFGEFDTYIVESDSLTGPWKLVHYLPSFGKQGYYPNLPSKFLSRDGKNAWMWYGANFSPWDREADPPGSAYKLVAQRIRFLTPGDTP